MQELLRASQLLPNALMLHALSRDGFCICAHFSERLLCREGTFLPLLLPSGNKDHRIHDAVQFSHQSPVFCTVFLLKSA